MSLAHDSGLPPRRRPCAATSTPLRRALHHYTNLAVDFVHYFDSMANNVEASGLHIPFLSLSLSFLYSRTPTVYPSQ